MTWACVVEYGVEGDMADQVGTFAITDRFVSNYD
jgi:hypothetical protein